MRVILRVLLPVLAALFIGGGAMYWWDRYHPETQVYYVETTWNIAADLGIKHNKITTVHLWNPSKRIAGTNLHVAIHVPAVADLDVGDIMTAESLAQLDITVREEEAESKTVDMLIGRLAPGSSITVPVYWRSLARPSLPVEVEGSADQCVLLRRDPSSSPSRLPLIALFLLGAITGGTVLIGLILTHAMTRDLLYAICQPAWIDEEECQCPECRARREAVDSSD